MITCGCHHLNDEPQWVEFLESTGTNELVSRIGWYVRDVRAQDWYIQCQTDPKAQDPGLRWRHTRGSTQGKLIMLFGFVRCGASAFVAENPQTDTHPAGVIRRLTQDMTIYEVDMIDVMWYVGIILWCAFLVNGLIKSALTDRHQGRGGSDRDSQTEAPRSTDAAVQTLTPDLSGQASVSTETAVEMFSRDQLLYLDERTRKVHFWASCAQAPRAPVWLGVCNACTP